jgi:hypothetical protein
VITVDLSDPAAALPALLQWLDLVRRKLAATYEKFEKKGLQLPEQLRTRAKAGVPRCDARYVVLPYQYEKSVTYCGSYNALV